MSWISLKNHLICFSRGIFQYHDKIFLKDCERINNLFILENTIISKWIQFKPMAFSVNHNLVTLSKNQLKSGRYIAELLCAVCTKRGECKAKQERDPRRRHRRHRGRHRGLSQRWPSSSPKPKIDVFFEKKFVKSKFKTRNIWYKRDHDDNDDG